MYNDNDLNDDIISPHEELLYMLMHELRGICHIIKANSEELSKIVSSKQVTNKTNEIQEISGELFDNAYLMSLWLDIADFELDPEFFASQELEPRSLYGKFYKALISFKRLAKKKNIDITLDGDSKTSIDMFPVIDILPYIFLDNALKYSPSSGDISITFNETPMYVLIEINSMGPLVISHEIPKLLEKGFRAKHAENFQGSGRGLAMAKFICDLHGAEIKIESKGQPIELDDIQYRSFIVNLTFPKEL